MGEASRKSKRGNKHLLGRREKRELRKKKSNTTETNPRTSKIRETDRREKEAAGRKRHIS